VNDEETNDWNLYLKESGQTRGILGLQRMTDAMIQRPTRSWTAAGGYLWVLLNKDNLGEPTGKKPSAGRYRSGPWGNCYLSCGLN